MKNDFNKLWKDVSDQCKRQYGIDVGNNATFVAQTIVSQCIGQNEFTYAECGVYLGTTFFPIYHLCERLFDKFHLFALDSFAGFPESAAHVMDDFSQFEILFNAGKITSEHFEAAKMRYAKLQSDQHLLTSYFSDYVDEFKSRAEGKNNLTMVACSFDNLNSAIKEAKDRYDLVFLDCDLYLSYLSCLDYFKGKTNTFIFDEYYSLKYPGARIACDEFLEKEDGWSLFNKTEETPYFERWGIRKTQDSSA